MAKRLRDEIPGAVILDQYGNVGCLSFPNTTALTPPILKINNPLAHEYTTGPEIIEAVVNTPSTQQRPSSGKVDALVAGAGTGGTVSGLSRAIKKSHNPQCVIVGVDPVRDVCHGRIVSILNPVARKGAF